MNDAFFDLFRLLRAVGFVLFFLFKCLDLKVGLINICNIMQFLVGILL